MKLANRRYLAALGIAGGAVAIGALGMALYRRRKAAGAGAPALKTVPFVDVGRYMGKWYEIARYPVTFEQNCYGSTFEYTRRPDGTIVVVYSCRKGSFDAPLEASEGIAVVLDPRTNAKLSMQSFWPLSGDYWIIDLDKNYLYSVATNSDRTALWIFSRTPGIEEGTYNRILERLSAKGFDINKIRKTPQPQEKLSA
ncbi:MAG: lipocalin family protein [Endomicrobiales bacterium]